MLKNLVCCNTCELFSQKQCCCKCCEFIYKYVAKCEFIAQAKHTTKGDYMTDETLNITLANLRDDIDMLLNAHYSTTPDGIAGMKERIASAIANIDTLNTSLGETNVKLTQDETTLNTCVEHNAFIDQMITPLVTQNQTDILNLWTDFRTFLDYFLKLQEKQDTVELSEKINLWMPYLAKLRKILDILDETDAQALKDLLENGTSGTATVSEELETQVNQNTSNIAALQGKVTTLEGQVAKYLTPPDPNYTGKTFTDYPAGTIWQTYDYDERILDLSSTKLITAPTIYFTAEAGASGKIKQTFSLSSTGAVTGIVKTYLNGTLLDTRNVDMQENETNNISFELFDCPLNTESQANDIYTTFSYNSSGKTLNLTYQKIEITASNAQCINKICPFNAFYFNGYYYLTDCSTGTLKTAQILATDMHNMDNLTWTDTGIPAVECVMGGTYQFNSDNTFYEDKVYYFRRGLDQQIYAGELSDKISTLLKNVYQLDTVTDHSTSITLVVKYNNTSAYYSSYSPSNKTISNLLSRPNDLDGLLYSGAKYYDDTPYSVLSFCVRQDNQTQNSLGIVNNINRFDVLDGVNSTLIAYDIQSTSRYKSRVYIKHKDKMIMQVVDKTNSNTYELLSTTEIGTYDKYFEMPNNDYFVIKNNQLLYYKKDE